MLNLKLGALARFATAVIAIAGATVGMIAVASLVLRPAAAADGVPDFAPNSSTGWLAQDDDSIQPPGGPGPVKSDPSRPYISFYKLRDNPHPMFRLADLNNPILQPWTRDALAKVNARVKAGGYVSIPKERCWPAGVPGFLLLPATPVYFLQTNKEVVMIWMQDHQVRHVYLDVPHSASLKPTWYGESVGHYEGDTLVVDTVALSSRTFVDNYQTPHTDQLHVVERYRMVNGGKMLEAKIHVEDPGAFITPWDAIQRYRRVEQGPMVEMACAENNDDHFQQGLEPMPQADKPDF